MRTLLALSLAMALLAVSGPASAVDGVVNSNPGQESTVATMTLAVGDVVDYTYSAGAFGGSVEFSIERGGTEVFNTTSTATTGTFTATVAGEHTFKFRNDGSYVAPVSYHIAPRTNSNTLLLVAGLGGALGAVGLGAGLWLRSKRKRGAPPPVAGPPLQPPPPPQ